MMPSTTVFRGRRAYFALAALALSIPHYVSAAIPISTCGATCTADCELTGDLACTASQNGVTLANGADLDMRGFNIGCVDADGCGAAVVMTGPNSMVKSLSSQDSSDPLPRILDKWTKGIDCQAQSGSRVTGITLRGYWGAGAIYKCQTADFNTIVGLVDAFNTADPEYPVVPNYGIFHTPISNADFIGNNYVDGCVTSIYRASVGPLTTVTIDNNTINYRDYSPEGFPFNAAINLPSLGNPPVHRPAVVQNNVFTGDGRGAIVQTTPSGNPQVMYYNNVCKRGLSQFAHCVPQGFVSSP